MSDLTTKRALRDATTGILRGKALALLTADPDGLMLGQATATAADQAFTVASFTGALVAVAGTGRFAQPRNITITTAQATGAYATGASNPITVTGIRGWDGATVSESFTLANADGAETTSEGVVLFSQVTGVSVPAQALAIGSVSVGCGVAAMALGGATGAITADSGGGIGNNHQSTGGGARGVFLSAQANLVVTHWDDDATTSYTTMAGGVYHPLWIKSIHTGTSTGASIVAGK